MKGIKTDQNKGCIILNKFYLFWEASSNELEDEIKQ